MRLVTPPLVIEELDGFKNDALQRMSFGESLANLITRSTDELVISLNGRWGEGKTTFAKMLQGLLKEKGVPSIYIDAFQNDYTEDAFISIASAITSHVDQHSTEKDKGSNFKDKAKKVGVRLLSWGARIGIKAATLGAIKESDIDALSEIGEDIASDTSEIISELIKERLTAHAKENEIIQSFRESLSEIPATLEGNESGRLVIIIDELDRCKPSFAVEILEKIKHLFSVKNIVFLLVMHREQLEEAIKSVYGSNIDAHTYLQKFINIETTIPKRISSQHQNDLKSYSVRLLRLHEIETWGDERDILDCLTPLAQHFDLSLRQLEKVFTNLTIIYSTSAKNHLRLVPIITFVSVIKIVNPGLFAKLSSQRASYTELCKETRTNSLDEKNEVDRQLLKIMRWVKFSILTETEYQKLEDSDPASRLGGSLWEYNVNRENLIPILCQKLNMFTIN